MEKAEFMALISQGVEAWNGWREAHPDVRPDLGGGDLGGAELQGVNFSEACLSLASFHLADLSGANFRGADLSGADLLLADLSGADLSLAFAHRANLSRTDLCEASCGLANLSEVNLSRADLSRADLSQVDLSQADLSRAYAGGADLSGADLSRADLSRADLSRADLSHASLARALIGLTVFGDNDLSEVRDLDLVHHCDPSSIGTDTLSRSVGRVPEVFLKGTGVPAHLIDPDFSGDREAQGYASCFLSFSEQDRAFAEQLYGDLQGRGVMCWLAPEALKERERFDGIFGEVSGVQSRLLLVLSAGAIESGWIRKEIGAAFKKERKWGGVVLVPVCIGAEALDTEWAEELERTRPIGDFRAWDQEAGVYDEGLRHLLEELRV